MNKEEILEKHEKLRSLKKIKILKVDKDKQIPIDVKKNDTVEMVRRKIIKALVNENTYYYVDNCNIDEFEYVKQQLEYYIDLFFRENESLESIIKERKVKLAGMTFNVVPITCIAEPKRVDLKTNRFYVDKDKFESILKFESGETLFLHWVGKLILDVMTANIVGWLDRKSVV